MPCQNPCMTPPKATFSFRLPLDVADRFRTLTKKLGSNPAATTEELVTELVAASVKKPRGGNCRKGAKI